MKGIQLTLEEKQLLVEALLFSSITDICAEWTPKQHQLMLELAKKINVPDVRLNNIYLFEGGPFDNPILAEQTKKDFTNLPRSSIITD
jgi:hypothetical protein